MRQNHVCHIRIYIYIYIRVQFQGIEPNKAGQDSVINNKSHNRHRRMAELHKRPV